MPTYEYECTNQDCKNTWEQDQSIKDEAIRECPKCQQQTAKRLISKSNFVLQGGGWASTGYS